MFSKLARLGVGIMKELSVEKVTPLCSTGFPGRSCGQYWRSQFELHQEAKVPQSTIFHTHYQFSTTARSDGEEKEKISVSFVDKDGDEYNIEVPIGMSMLEAAHKNDIELEGACEGSIACSTCHVIITDVGYYNKLEDPTDEENDMLDLAFGLTDTSRLGCQIIAKPELNGMRLVIPAATRNFAVDGKGLVSCFISSFGLLYHNHSYNCKIRAFITDPICRNRRNYSTQVLLDPANERFSHNIPTYDHPYETSDNLLHSPNLTGQTYSVLRSSALQHWFKNWQEKRRHKLTASTFGAAIGFWPRRRVQLWLEKIGAIEPFSGNLATCWSNIKEEEALERYKLITGNTVLFPEFQVYGENNTENSWLAASPDGVVDRLVYELPSRGVLEIKCPFFDGDMSKATPWKRVPLHYIPQTQGLMEILDRDWMDFYVWTPKGSSLFRIFRDVEYWDSLKIVLSDFWWKHVQPARDLCSRYVITDPLKQLQVLKPAPRHELYYCMIIKSKRVVDGSNLLVREIDGKLQD